MIAKCKLCGFSVPWDEIGKAIMTEHLRKEHPTEADTKVKMVEKGGKLKW